MENAKCSKRWPRRGSWVGAKGEIKGCALIEGGFDPNPTAMAADNMLGHGQADACALEVVGVMETLKNAEKPVGVGHIKTDAVVANEKDYAIVAAN